MSSIDMPVGSSSSSERSGPSTRLVVAGLVVLALVLRLWELGDRALHHDESLDAWWSWLFRNGRFERYDPVYHGPLRFYITAGFYELFGESEATARLFSALTGAAVVGLPWFLRRELGRAGTIAASAALCISPTMLYYSRFGREDAQMVFLTLAAMVLGLAYLRRPRTLTAGLLAFVLACSFAIKESTYLFGLLLAVYLLVVLAAQFDATVRGSTRDGSAFDPGFFTSALTLASIGLIVAVVVGARSDELFAALGLYIAALAALVAATAMPALRSAGITWTALQAAGAIIGIGILGQAVRVWGADPAATWQMSTLSAVTVLAIAALIVALMAAPPLRDLPEASTWAVTFAIGAAGIVALEWTERTVVTRKATEAAAVAAGEPATAWQVSVPALGVGLLAIAIALVLHLGDRLQGGTDPITALSLPPATRSLLAGTLGTWGAALSLNEYTESEPDRLVAGVFLGVVIAAALLAVRSLPRTGAEFEWPPLLRSVGAIGWRGWAIALSVFAVSWWLFFTVWGTVKDDWASGFTRAIDYWDSQQEVNRGGQPWYYYLYALPAYEWFFVVLAAVGSWRCLRRPTMMTGLFVWFAIGSLALYSYAGERMPWLIAHPLLPILILAGFGVTTLWDHRDHAIMPAVATAVALGLTLTTATAVRASFPNGTDARELLSQAGQATPHVTSALERLENIDRLAMRATGEPAHLAIGTANAWPWSWYLRERPNVTWFTSDDGPPSDGSVDVIIVDYGTIDLGDFSDYHPTVFAMRSWWVPTYTEGSALDWARWARDRSLWPQGINAGYQGVGEVSDVELEGGVSATLDRLRDGVDDAASDLVLFGGAGRDLIHGEIVDDEFDDGRDGCGSVDQYFLVRNEYATVEAQVYPDPIEAMGPLACASDLLATS